MNATRLQSVCAWLAFLAIALGFLAGNTKNITPRTLPADLNSPLLAMELLRQPADAALIIGKGDHNDGPAMVTLMHYDFLFIASYTSLFVFAGVLLYKYGRRLTGGLVILFGICAAGCDVGENLRILQIVAGGVNTPRLFSLTKWALISLTLVALSRIYTQPNLPKIRIVLGRIAATVSILAAVITLDGIVFHLDPIVETGAQLIGFSLLLGWLFFATHAILAQGLLGALNRLARIRGFSYLATWPSDES